jgi:hypothetical protein
MWRLQITTPDASVSVLCDENLAKTEIACWQSYEKRTAEAIEEMNAAYDTGKEYFDKEGRLVRAIQGEYEVEMSEADRERGAEPKFFETIIAYRFIDVIGMAIQRVS